MANFVVLSVADMPALGETMGIVAYRGSHAAASDAVSAAANLLNAPTGSQLWVTDQVNMTRYVITENRTFSSVAG